MALQSLLINSIPAEEITVENNPDNKLFATVESTFKITPVVGATWVPDATKIEPVFVTSTKVLVKQKE